MENNLVDLIISKDNTVTKSNLLIEAIYKLSSTEFKLIQTVFSNIQPGDTTTNKYIFQIKEFLELLELKGQSGYTELKKITFDLFKKPISIQIDGKTSQLNWLSFVQYNDRQGTITIEINEFWEKYLLSLTNNFTSYKLFNITNLKSAYSLRLYELLKSRINLNSIRTISVIELRAKMGIEDEQYPRYANFKQRVILQAQRELLAESDICFNFIEIKKGRSVEKIEFHIARNPRNSSPSEVAAAIYGDSTSSLTSALSIYGVAPKVIDELIVKFSEERILSNIEYVKKMIEDGVVGKPPGYLKKAIEDDYAQNLPKIKTSKKMEQAFALKGDNKEAEKILYDKSAAKHEEHLINVKALKESMGLTKENIWDDLFGQMMNYQKFQEKNYGQLVAPTNFTDKYIQQICKSVITDFYN
jgi:plasmid replication initiation protein